MQIKAAVARAPGQIDIESIEIEEPRDDEILVRIVATGLCHTDISALDGVLPVTFPIVLGHEGAGVVEKIGAGITKVQPGDHVLMTYDYCGRCPSCDERAYTYCHSAIDRNFGGNRPDDSSPLSQDGAKITGSFFGQSSLAGHAICTERNVVKVPRDVPLEILGPLACGVQTGAGAVLNSLRIEDGATFAVFGVGSVGLSAVMAAKVAGALRIIAVDVSERRLELARSLGATETIDGATTDALSEIMKLTGYGVRYALDTSGQKQVMMQAFAATAPRGTCAWLAGVSPDMRIEVDPTFLLKGRKLRGLIEGDSHDAAAFINRLIDLYRAKRFPFDRLITFYAADQLNLAIADAHAGKVIKPVLRFSD